MRAGVFDSGIGGVSVLKSLLDSKFFSEIVYYGDIARVPYGSRDKDTIIRYSLEALDFFAPYEIDILIVACNTVSAYALEIMRSQAPYPIIGVIEAGVLALQNKIDYQDSQILIIGTEATIKSQVYPVALQKLGYQNVCSIATPLFVPFVEEGILDGDFLNQCLKHYFKNLKGLPDAIILGCTHYPFISKAISQYFQNQSLLIHSGEAIVEDLKRRGIKPSSFETQISFFSSEDSEKLTQRAKKMLELMD